MIHRIASDLATFKDLEFRSGLNVLIAQKEQGASEKQTRNRAGKTSLVEIIHFLTGSDAGKDSLFRQRALDRFTFQMTFDLEGRALNVSRSGKEKSKVKLRAVGGLTTGQEQISNSEWLERLGNAMFGLDEVQATEGRAPTFRSLFAYFVRRQLSGAFTSPEKQAIMQQIGDYQVALLFLLGLDWKLACDWQLVRDRERMLAELRKAAGQGAFGSIVGRAADLRTELTISEARLDELLRQIRNYRVLPQYREFELKADAITRRLNELSNGNVIDEASIRDLEAAMSTESMPELSHLERLYEEAGVALPGVTIRRFEEVQSFHSSVIQNRRDYLATELAAATERVKNRRAEMDGLDAARAEVMAILSSYGALEQFAKLQEQAVRQQAHVESLRSRFEAAEQLEGEKNELEIERNRLMLRLRRDFSEQRDRLTDAILAFEETSRQLYESAGSMTVDETTNGPMFQFPMQGSRSKGIKNMQIFCFDMMLMRICAKRGFGPGFLVHDSHLFDGVDGRQVISAIKLGAQIADEIGFQYIVTMNEDDAYKEQIEGFDIRDYVLPVVLTDANDDGGLFGFRF